MVVKLAGNDEEEVDDLASCGAYGKNSGSIAKDMMNKFCSNMVIPEPVHVQVPYRDPTARELALLFTEMSMYLPSQWFRALSQCESLFPEMDSIFGHIPFSFLLGHRN